MRYEPADLFFVAGEASGDLQASLLARAVARLVPDLRVGAIGGERLREAGARVIYDATELASIGPVSILPKIPVLYAIVRGLETALRKHPPGIFIPVDAGAINLRLVTWLRKGGYRAPILYYFPPGAWLDNVEQARKVADQTVPVTPFARQRDFYAHNGLRAEWFGHPLASVIHRRASEPSTPRPLVAILPGSRREEVAHHLDVLARAASRLSAAANVSFVCVAASQARADQIRTLWSRSGGPNEMSISRAGVVAAVANATVAWTSSGTAALETALVGVPQIVFYRVSKTQYRLARHQLPRRLLESIALPNLVLGRRVVPELLQADFTAENLERLTLSLLTDEAARRAQVTACDEMRVALGPADALERIATFVAERLQQRAAS
ncbi:MAG TPA: hypothetical protein VEJ41_03115 [Candidatus Acidoferrales bacterium]|nr:hypothetical protein [Candidatus Acidoferrales bacterium]